MISSRRDFLVAATAAAAGLALAPRAIARRDRSSADEYFDWRVVKTGAGEARVAFGEGGNALLLPRKDHNLLVDCKTPAFGAVLLREVLGGPRTVVVNTHHHADHTGGNHAMRAALVSNGPSGQSGVEKIIALDKCTARVESGGNMDRYRGQVDSAARSLVKSDKPGAKEVLKDAQALAARLDSMTGKDFAPTESIKENTEIEIDGERVLLRHAGPGHTDNDLFVFVPRLNILHTGDLLFHKLHPVIDRPGGASTRGWLVSLKAMIDLCDGETVVIPGHGELTGVEGLKSQATYLETTREAVGKAIEKGASRAEVEAIELDDYKDYGNPAFRPRALGAIYEELSEKTDAAPSK